MRRILGGRPQAELVEVRLEAREERFHRVEAVLVRHATGRIGIGGDEGAERRGRRDGRGGRELLRLRPVRELKR